MSDETWRNCNMCKRGIGYQADYFVCSVSTCNRKRTGLIFCSLPCFEAHLPMARHRDAWAQGEKAPTRAAWQAERAREAASSASEPQAAAREAASPGAGSSEADEHEVLVVVSKLKKYVRDRSGMNTSDAAMNVISDHLRALCREAIRSAGQDGRRTVLDRDFTKVLAAERR